MCVCVGVRVCVCARVYISLSRSLSLSLSLSECAISDADIFTCLSSIFQKFRWKYWMVPYYFRNLIQNGPKTPRKDQSRERPNTFLTTTVVSIHSRKISREYFNILKALRNILKLSPKIFHNSSEQGDACCEIFHGALTVRVKRKTSL